ncbi:MAG TPA: hypothetical protein VJY35_15830 [Candidatus Eisenbacteria bacterium]|nr:hypothetical protein [Candidatus Eisenbacteria bacterium]
MQNLSPFVSLARLSRPWATCHTARLRSTLSRLVETLSRWTHAFDPCRLPAPVPLPVSVPRLRVAAAVSSLWLFAALGAPAQAGVGNRVELASDGRLVDVQVLVDGHAAPLYTAQGRWDRRYFQAFRGRNYALALTNNTGRRVGVLIAVDGLNVVNGQRSRLAADEAMYVLDPWERTTIRGWRTSLDQIRKFVFVDEERSYAERTGQANGDMGWIRVLAFNEQGRPWYDQIPGRINQNQRERKDDDEYRFDEEMSRSGESKSQGAAPPPVAEGQNGLDRARPESASPNKSMYRGDSPSTQSVPGTGWGERGHDPVRRVWFVPERNATDHLVLRYEYASGLRALGIQPRNYRDRIRERENGDLGFAQPPRW